MKRHLKRKSCVLVAVLLLVVMYFIPNPLVRHTDTSKIISILYRADDEDMLRYFNPTQEAKSIDEENLLQLLNNSRAVRKLIPSSTIDGIPSGAVTLMITVSEGKEIKYIILGDLNRMDIQDSPVEYHILNSDSVLNQALEILGIDINTD